MGQKHTVTSKNFTTLAESVVVLNLVINYFGLLGNVGKRMHRQVTRPTLFGAGDALHPVL